MGNYKSLKDVVRDASKGGTNILSFRSTRAKLRYDFSQNEGSGRAMLDNATFLDAYNCDSSSSPKPEWADRARKQIYRADYVKYHFVHYSTVTEGILQPFSNSTGRWYRSFGERFPSERVTDEINEGAFQLNLVGLLHNGVSAFVSTSYVSLFSCHSIYSAVMLHAKTTLPQQTSNFKNRCHYQFEKKWRGCYVGFPWPNGKEEKGERGHREDGMEYNCFENYNITNYWGPRLRAALARRRQEVTSS